MPKREANNNSTKETKEIDTLPLRQDSLVSLCTSGYNTLKTSDTSEKEQHSLSSLNEETKILEKQIKVNDEMKSDSDKEQNSLSSLNEICDNTKIETQCRSKTEGKELNLTFLTDVSSKFDNDNHDSLTSVGESSGYDSFRYRLEDNEDEGYAEDSFRKQFLKSNLIQDVKDYDEVSGLRSWRVSAESIIGIIFILVIMKILLYYFHFFCLYNISGVIIIVCAVPVPQ